MSRFTSLKSVFLKHKFQLIITYTLFGLEMLGTLLRPYFLGKAMDDIFEGSYKGLIVLASTHLAWLIIGSIRHMYDTRTYTSIYTTIVTRLLSRKFDASEVSKLSAHSTLAREFVDFLEYDLRYVIEAAYNLIGSLILLYFYERQVVGICLLIMIPVMAVSYFYGKKMKKLNRIKNDQLEEQVDVIATGDPNQIQRYYQQLRTSQICISDQEAWNFGFMELMVLVVITYSLMMATDLAGENLLAGSLLGIYNYILKFASGLDTIPYSIQRYSQLKDITLRMELEEELIAVQ
ncbi:MAG: ABC transporter six-transmembrane domain-containing protein [Candidatus Kapaibacterium sp.]|nr:ABC transporter six-transmembrane domain-containing protein [Bacteroidota bacterium]